MRSAVLLLLTAGAWAQTGTDLENRAPVLIYKTNPEYPEAARKASREGTVVLYVEVGLDGRVHHVRVIRALGLGLDEKAIEAVRHWRFQPARKHGRPAVVAATIEVVFRLDGTAHSRQV